MNYWFIFVGNNNDRVRYIFGTDYLIIKAKQKKCTRKFLNNIAEILDIKQVNKSEVELLKIHRVNTNGRTYICGDNINMELPSHCISYTTLIGD